MKALRLLETDIDLDEVNRTFANRSAEEVVTWAVDRFGERLVMSSSFGAHSAVTLHLVSQIAPGMPVVFIDTGYLFPETYRFAEALKERLQLNLKVFSASMTAARQEALYGKSWDEGEEGVKRYLWLNKVEPMQRALAELGTTAWISGIRGDQTDHRRTLRVVDMQDGRYKVHPIHRWSLAEVEEYIRRHDLPIHPLVEQGYRSIGDTHSTLPTFEGQDPREGRILGQKKECGLHLPLTKEQNESLKSSGL